MKTFIKLKKLHIDKYRVAANITEFHIISKLIFLRIITPKFTNIRELFHVKMYVEMSKKWTYGLFGHTYQVATLLYCTQLY